MLRAFLVVGAIIVSSAGCAQLAGIDETTGNGRAGDSVTLQRMSIGTTVELSPIDLTGLQASFLVVNPGSATGFDRVPASASADGKWTSKLREPAPVELTLPDLPAPLPRVYAFPTAALSILYSVLEHPKRSPAPEGAMLAVTAQLEAASTLTDSFQVYTVGSWTSHALVTGTEGLMTVALSYAFNTSSNLSGRSQLDQLTLQDAFLILRYAGAALTGVAEAAPFVQTGNDTVSAMMAKVEQDQVLDVKLSAAALATRYAAVRPAVGSLAMSWSLVAAPGYRVASNAGPVLYSGGLVAADVGVNIKYGNPFAAPPRSWNTIFTLATSESRVYTPAGTMTPVTLFAGMNQYIEPSPGFMLTLPAGLPELISFDGKPLSTDGQTIPKPTRFVEVMVTADNSNTLFDLYVYDLLPNAAATALDLHLVFVAESNLTQLTIPPEIFQIGHSYTLRAVGIAGGYPRIVDGDLVSRELPLSLSYLDSGVFTVTPTVAP